MTRIAGLPQTASERAFDMFLKVRHIQSINGGGGVVFATGTPIANSMAEMFTMQRYLQPDDLKKHNLNHFDSWAATFGEPVTAMELAPDGAGYRLNTRFARFINVPELMQLFRQTADVQTAQMLNLPRPKLEVKSRPFAVRPPHQNSKSLCSNWLSAQTASECDKSIPMKITCSNHDRGTEGRTRLRLMLPSVPDNPKARSTLPSKTFIGFGSHRKMIA